MKGFVINLDERTDRMERFKQNQIPFEIHRFSAIKSEKGEDGCTKSHLAVLNQISENNLFPCVVFEDDCVLIQPWEFVTMAINQLECSFGNWDALWLGANLRQKIVQTTVNTFRLKDAYALHAVIYNSKRMVDFILNTHGTQPGQNLDIFYRKSVFPRFYCYITYPMVATQLSDYSDIAHVKTDNFIELIDSYKKNVQ